MPSWKFSFWRTLTCKNKLKESADVTLIYILPIRESSSRRSIPKKVIFLNMHIDDYVGKYLYYITFIKLSTTYKSERYLSTDKTERKNGPFPLCVSKNQIYIFQIGYKSYDWSRYSLLLWIALKFQKAQILIFVSFRGGVKGAPVPNSVLSSFFLLFPSFL